MREGGKMFIDRNGNLYNGDMQVGDREATVKEVEAWQAQVSKEANKQSILSQITELEAQQQRPLRELMINQNSEFAKSKILEIDTKITELRKQL